MAKQLLKEGPAWVSSLQVNIKEEAIITKKIVRDCLLVNKIDLSVPNKLIIACNTAHSQCEVSKEKTEKELLESFACLITLAV